MLRSPVRRSRATEKLPKPPLSRPAIALLCLGAQPAQSAEPMSPPLAPFKVDITSWPRMPAQEFGCYPEKTFGYQDKRINSSLKHYKNGSNVCNHAGEYCEGPAFPDRLATRVHPLAESIELSWEHGDLQRVSLTLKGTWNEKELRGTFACRARTRRSCRTPSGKTYRSG